MKKFIPAIGLVLITLLFTNCSVEDNNTDPVLAQQIEGKWKLTKYVSDVPSDEYPIANGYEMELKSDGTFTSNEEDGYTGGTYTVLKTPGKNLRLSFNKQWAGKVVYKYINTTTPDYLYLQPSNVDALSDETVFYDGYELTRIP